MQAGRGGPGRARRGGESQAGPPIGPVAQDNYKTTTRQLQDNSQDNPQDNSFLLAGVCIHENKDISFIFNSWNALV